MMRPSNAEAGWFPKIFKDLRFIGLVYLLIVLIATGIKYFVLGIKYYQEGGLPYTHYNNYIIFKQSFFHLLQHKDLYLAYPYKYWDLYKYSPTFSLLMGLFAFLPDFAGLVMWNLLNALLLYWAIRSMPILAEQKEKAYILWFITQEMLTSIQEAQSNSLLAALIILAFNAFEKRKVWLAALFIICSFYIKLFGIVAAVLFLFYPDKLKFIGWSFLWGVFFLLIPMVVITPESLWFQYNNWLRLLAQDHGASHGLSVMGWLYTWFGLEVNKLLVVLIGALLFCLPLIKFRSYGDLTFRLLYLSSILIWIVIFNHKAESPTFVIAMCGVGIWYFIQPANWLHYTLVILAFVFTSLSPTDLFPRFLREYLVIPYVLKAVFCIFIWFRIVSQALLGGYKTRPLQYQNAN